MVQPFRIDVPESVLADLARRLANTRLPAPATESDPTSTRVEQLILHWRDAYDWSAQQRRLNGYPHFRAEVDGVGLHLLHLPGTGPAPLPLLLMNGWPSSFVEYLGVLGPLANPGAYGGDPADAFSVVVPALPGFGFSDQCLDRLMPRDVIATLFDRLMTGHLGYSRYVAHGDDIGGAVVHRLGVNHPDSVIAIQTANWMAPPPTTLLTPAEQSFVDGDEEWDRRNGAYRHVQATRPRVLGYSLADSPAGLAGWILEKWLTWTDPATRDRVSTEDLLTTVMLYWCTGTGYSAERLYASATPLGPDDIVRVPTSVLVPNEPELPKPPREWLLRGYPQLVRHVEVEAGGHFLAAEAPERFVAELREAFRPYRPGA